MKTMKMYLAGAWFSKQQKDDLDVIETMCESIGWIDVKSPRKIFVCPPNADFETQENTFQGNLTHIKEADFVVATTQPGPRGIDAGTLWECGYAFAVGTPIVYICAGLPETALFNLMLSRSGIKVCTSYEQLEDYLDRCREAGELLVEPYDAAIE